MFRPEGRRKKMKIYLQDRQKIITMPKEVWATKNSKCYSIIVTSYITPILGNYETEQRAMEVLNQIFEYYRNGKNSYVMPEQ